VALGDLERGQRAGDVQLLETREEHKGDAARHASQHGMKSGICVIAAKPVTGHAGHPSHHRKPP
jgi:hypothetical protein